MRSERERTCFSKIIGRLIVASGIKVLGGGGDGKYINFNIPNRSRKCKGIINGLDKRSTLDELVSAMVDKSGVLEVERLKKRVYDRETRNMKDEYSPVVCVTWKGNHIPNDIRIYGGITGLRVRPFIDNVLQCYGCYRFGHLLRHCRRAPICIACGEFFHGNCNKEWRCVNCGG